MDVRSSKSGCLHLTTQPRSSRRLPYVQHTDLALSVSLLLRLDDDARRPDIGRIKGRQPGGRSKLCWFTVGISVDCQCAVIKHGYIRDESR
jgi:hypothetical protein